MDVSVVKCNSYEDSEVTHALCEALSAVGGLDFVTEGMTVALKANLVSFMRPEAAGTTHPAVIIALTRMLRERGARVIIGDSPGGLYNSVYVGRIYNATGMRAAVEAGAELNEDFSVSEAEFPEATAAKKFKYTSYLDKVDAIIDVCKLKTHGMMGMSCAAKNMFGVVPGTVKPEYHYRYPSYTDFSDMIVDLNEYFKPRLSVCDAIVGMEGNGPTAGKPRSIGCILASESPHKLDLAAAYIIGLGCDDVPTLDAARRRGLIPADVSGLEIFGDIEGFVIGDFDNIASKHSLSFYKDSNNIIKNIFGKIAGKALMSTPRVTKRECIGCGKCAKICPASAIEIKKGKAEIDRSKCIRCFCCQEFCPVGAMKVHRPAVARMLSK